jgi:LPS-assembly protein
MTLLRPILLLLALACAALPARAQDTSSALLIADEIFVAIDGSLVAKGNVEAHHSGVVLTASRVTYDPKADEMQIEGPIRLTDGDRVDILADAAALAPDLSEGLMQGARLVLDQQLQIASVQLNRTQGRYTQLYRTVATSCRVCDGGPPIWAIRAEKVIHDAEAQQLYFSNAQFRLLDVPILWLPRLRMPDPTLTRATGFLIPEGRVNSQLGTGIKIPYFIRMGDHRDLTLTPYLSARTNTLEFRYRQAFALGDLTVTGALAQDELGTGGLRGYAFANGSYQLARGYKLAFDIETSSDKAFLLDYGYSDKDRLDSAIALRRVKRDALFSGELVLFNTLRDFEANATQPTLIVDLDYERRLFPGWPGSELRLSAESHSHVRTSNQDALGRDVSRVQGTAHWLTAGATGNGVLFDLHGVLDLAAYGVAQDNTANDDRFAIVPAAYANLRWPLAGQGTAGGSHLIEPVLHLALSDSANEITNEESTRVEFDEANLLALSRFPAADQVEEGLRVALGTHWTRQGPRGTTHRLSVGKILRDAAEPEFSQTSGLDGTTSDWLLSGRLETTEGLTLASRAVFDDQFSVAKAATRLDWTTSWGDIAATHVWLTDDPAEGRATDLSEFGLSTSVDLSQTWTATANWQFDVVAQTTARAGVGLQYQNECLDLRMAASRRFTQSTTVDPSTDFDIRVGLRGFGAGRSGSDIIRRCGN